MPVAQVAVGAVSRALGEDRMKCTTCRFWKRTGEHSPRGLCRRNAPTDVTGGIWPVTRDEDWCGEYKPVEPRPEPPKLFYWETHEDGSTTKRYSWPLMDAPNFEWAEGWRRERAWRCWSQLQLFACWLAYEVETRELRDALESAQYDAMGEDC